MIDRFFDAECGVDLMTPEDLLLGRPEVSKHDAIEAITVEHERQVQAEGEAFAQRGRSSALGLNAIQLVSDMLTDVEIIMTRKTKARQDREVLNLVMDYERNHQKLARD